ncbi:caspase family protein [Rhodobacter sp. SGA-6-6]|uniref:caspase family protein n=1 Tax=Rhodobacter sp. SGA-6-6 TaxID=2710882 RepID=UPI0013EB6C77|nr:caspase family protein [Rhodobacter sp. SGA-6-6]NGM46817.1 caspase family protein [Rhodobacter sp. SGA-6-6]
MLRRVLFALCLLLATVSAAFAERRVALVLATEDYKSIRKLDNPVNDARAMETLLESLGFEVWLETDRDLKRMRRALEDFKTDAAGADVALVFYAGHGVALDGVNYLLPTDADATSSAALAASGLPLEEVRDVLDEVAPMAIMLLDACRDDPFAQGATGDGRGAVPLSGDPPEKKPPTPGLGRIGRADGVLFAFAAAPGETAADGNDGNSPFTSALLRHFGTKGVELKSALTLVQQDVYDRSRGKQLPYIESGLAELVFISGEGDLPERDQLLMAMASITPELRQEVEAVAAAHDMPLAPLYAALISADLGSQTAEDRQRLLQEAAASYAQFQQGLVKYASSDPRVAELRAKAEEQLALGATAAARELITEAAAIDAQARESLQENIAELTANLVERTVSEATSHVLNANAAKTDLRYDLAIEDLTKAAELYASVKDGLADRDTKFAYNDVLRDLGDLQVLAGNTNAALGIYLTRSEFAEAQVAANPADFGWSRELVWAMNSVGVVLQQQGYLREAEEAYTRAYEVTAKQNVDTPNDLLLMRDLEVALNKLGDVRFALNDLNGALLAYQEGLGISQSLLDQDPESILYNQDVSISHERIGDVLVAMGDRAAARDAFDVSLMISKKLADKYPDDMEIRRNLSVSYERLGDTMQAEGDLDAALAAFLEAQKIRDDLLAQDPGNATRKRDAALIYERVGEVYNRMGDAGSALMNQEAARGMRAELVALDPSNMLWARDLSVSHEKVGMIYQQEGEFAGALEAFSACRDLRLAIAAVDPGNLSAQRDLAICIHKWAQAEEGSGDPQGALSAHRTALDIRRGNAAADPENKIYQLDLTFSLSAMGKLSWTLGDLDAAMGSYDETIRILQAIVAHEPGDLPSHYDLMVYSTDMADVLLQRGDLEAAAGYAQLSMAAADALLAADPKLWDYRHGKLVAANRLGDAKARLQDAAGALEGYRVMAEIGYQLASEDPYNTGAAWDYALAMLRSGEQKLALQDYPGARADLEVAVSMRRWLAGQDPAAVQPQRELGWALQKLADSHFYEQNYDTGRPLEEEALAIFRWVDTQEPGQVWNIVDLATALDRASSYYGDPAPYLRESLALLEGLQAQGTLPEGYQSWIDNYRSKLGGN